MIGEARAERDQVLNLSLQGASVAVVGGGVLGLSVALQTVWCGADVVLYDLHDPAIDGASGIAAGMLAPGFEAALDPVSARHFPLLAAARELWPAMMERLQGAGVELDCSGAMWVARSHEAARLETIARRLAAMGARAETLDAAQARRLHPTLSSDICGAIHTTEDWRLDPPVVLRAMMSAFRDAGGRVELGRQDTVQVAGRGGTLLRVDAVVLAVGADSAPWRSLAPELAILQPIKGQILRCAAGPLYGPVVRGAEGYVAPQQSGAIVGATMEPGVSDLDVDPVALDALRRAATQLFPHLAEAPAEGRAAVRAGTPDGLPLLGPTGHRNSGGPQIVLAVGARRNGWLLAPMVGEIIARRLAGQSAGPYGDLMDARRFSQTVGQPTGAGVVCEP